MSASIPPSKRRRLNNAASTLSKPFKSPLKAAEQPDENHGREPSKEQQHANTPTAVTNHRSRPNTHPTTTTAQRSTQTPTRDRSKSDPQFLTLQKQHSSLLLQLTALRGSLTTAQQAVKIAASSSSSSSSNHDLESLILKWKLASREAAEEVFNGAKDRVNGMGGVGAWRERSRENAKSGWNREEEEQQRGGEQLNEEQRGKWKDQREELEEERRKYEPERAEEEQADEKYDDDVSDL